MVHIIGQEQKQEDKIEIDEVVKAIQYLSVQYQELRYFLSAAAKKTDINSLTISALTGFIVDKGVATNKEVEEMIEEKVIKVYKEQEELAKKEALKRQEEMQREQMKDLDLSNNAIKEAQETFQKNRKKK